MLVVHGETGHGCQSLAGLLLSAPTLEVRERDLVRARGQTGPVLALDRHRLLERLHGVVTGAPGELRVDDLLDVLPHEGPGALLGTVAQRLQAVAALQHQGDLPPGQGHQLVGEVGEAGWTDIVASDGMLVAPGRVKPGRHQDEVRVKVRGDWHHAGPEGGEILGVSHGRLEAA